MLNIMVGTSLRILLLFAGLLLLGNIREVLERLGLGYYVESFGERSLVESVYRSSRGRVHSSTA
jgi:hypothetical protein